MQIDLADIDLDGSGVTLDSPEPTGYMQWQYWAALQHRAGRRQYRCKRCLKFRWKHLDTCGGCKELAAKKTTG